MSNVATLVLFGALFLAWGVGRCVGFPGSRLLLHGYVAAFAASLLGEATAFLLHRRWARRRLAERGVGLRRFRRSSAFVLKDGPFRWLDWSAQYTAIAVGRDGEEREYRASVCGPLYGLRPGGRSLWAADEMTGKD